MNSMQEAVPRCVRTGRDNVRTRSAGEREGSCMVINTGRKDDVRRMAKENAVMVYARNGCCMSLVVKRLLQGLGVNPAVYEVEEGFEDLVVSELREADGGGGGGGGSDDVVQFPVVFIGGRWFGGLDRVIATHVKGELTPLLKQVQALWL